MIGNHRGAANPANPGADEPRVYYKPWCGPAVLQLIEESVGLVMKKEPPSAGEVIEANIRILDAVTPELSGDALGRAMRSRKQLRDQLKQLATALR